MHTWWLGCFPLRVCSYVALTLVMVQLTILSVTLYLHRSQAHRSCDFHPALAHVFRFWIWFTTSMLTNEWVAIHRCHHARVETEEDPHSPWVHGIWNVLFRGAAIYSRAAKNKEIVKKYSHGTPKDWIEKAVYQKHQTLGVKLLLVLHVWCFGVVGLVMWGVQMVWIPLHAAGVINGLGHYLGYRNFQTQDKSTNLYSFACWIGGEELHNNHHAFPDSARFSVKWYELDLGYAVLRVLSWCKLASIKRLAPELNQKTIDSCKTMLARWKLLVANRLRVLDRYHAEVLLPMFYTHAQKTGLVAGKQAKRLRAALMQSKYTLSEKDYQAMHTVIAQSNVLQKTRLFYEKLEMICNKTQAGQKEMQRLLKEWCMEAKKSGIQSLQMYSAWVEQAFVAPDLGKGVYT